MLAHHQRKLSQRALTLPGDLPTYLRVKRATLLAGLILVVAFVGWIAFEIWFGLTQAR